jgi:uncharacterized membrane protein
MSTLAFIILHRSVNQSTSSPNLIFIPIGGLFITLGNFQSNPAQLFYWNKNTWTLENKEVWKLIHILTEKLWVIGRLLIVLGSLTIDKSVLFIVSLVLLVLP